MTKNSIRLYILITMILHIEFCRINRFSSEYVSKMDLVIYEKKTERIQNTAEMRKHTEEKKPRGSDDEVRILYSTRKQQKENNPRTRNRESSSEAIREKFGDFSSGQVVGLREFGKIFHIVKWYAYENLTSFLHISSGASSDRWIKVLGFLNELCVVRFIYYPSSY